MSSQEALKAAWLEAPEGKLSGREQAEAWALREVWQEEGRGKYGMVAKASVEDLGLTPASRPTDRPTDRRTDRSTRPADRLTDRPTVIESNVKAPDRG